MTKMGQKERREVLLVAIGAAQKAAKILLRYQKKLEVLTLNSKQAQGLSSEADLKSEEIIIKTLCKAFPEHSFLAEENYYLQKKKGYHEYQNGLTWIIDPLDGTNNYLNGLPFFAISIALCAAGKPLLGLVYNPVYDECYSSIKGQGAYFSHLSVLGRGKKLALQEKRKKIQQCILSSGFSSAERGNYDDHEFKNFKNVYKKSRAVRRLGAAALELCYVAQGRLDGFWEYGLSPWDVAAGGLICQEVGVKVTDFSGRAFSPFDDSIIAANKSIYKEVIKLVEK